MCKTNLAELGSCFFIGIGGTSMSALAKYVLQSGKKVAGSDVSNSVYTEELCAMGVNISYSPDPTDIDGFDTVIYTDAIQSGDLRLLRAQELNKKIFSRGVFLSLISSEFKKVIAVAGCHGKTTCTCMLAHIFAAAGKKFASHAGGRDKLFGNFFMSGNDYFLTEACEYKKNFLHLKPDTAVVLNTQPDHLECYGSYENLLNSYNLFVSHADKKITLYGDNFNGGYTFGFDKNSTYYAEHISENAGMYSFDVCKNGRSLGSVALNIYGKHNITNALAAASAALGEGIAFEYIQQGLESFCGVERRFETIGKFNGVQCIADYAHHPTEIEANLKALVNITQKDLYVIFQPHTYSRTKNLFGDFVNVLGKADKLMIYRTFAAREYFDDAGSALTLSQSLKNSVYGDTPDDISDFLKKAKAGDVVAFLGAGDIYDVAKHLVNN